MIRSVHPSGNRAALRHTRRHCALAAAEWLERCVSSSFLEHPKRIYLLCLDTPWYEPCSEEVARTCRRGRNRSGRTGQRRSRSNSLRASVARQHACAELCSARQLFGFLFEPPNKPDTHERESARVGRASSGIDFGRVQNDGTRELDKSESTSWHSPRPAGWSRASSRTATGPDPTSLTLWRADRPRTLKDSHSNPVAIELDKFVELGLLPR